MILLFLNYYTYYSSDLQYKIYNKNIVNVTNHEVLYTYPQSLQHNTPLYAMNLHEKMNAHKVNFFYDEFSFINFSFSL